MNKQGTKKDISVVIPTFNCASELINCLETVKWADEIIIVDMGSIDETVLLSKKYKAKTYHRVPIDGNFDQNRKYGMEKATGDWILKLDSDEILSEKLQLEMKKFLYSYDDGKYNGFNLYNRIFMFGKEIKHGFVKSGSHELRLVRKGKWIYNPYKFHQQITISGKTSFMKNPYIHYNFRNINQFIRKTNLYTDLDAKITASQGSQGLLSTLFAPIKTFTKLYIVQMGFLDRQLGLIVSGLFSFYSLVEKIKILELRAKGL